ncbi:MAG: hypothetical protein J6W75_04980 [Bacteroidaceae bacterium]|nr:hypothetical protein [Bacteroidaceae bacterium]
MKKIYQTPELQITELQMQDGILLGLSETEVEGSKGGWVKEDRGSARGSQANYNVWDEDWSK